MSLHNFNPNNKSWKMYSNTLTSISGDNLTVKPYDGRNLLLEVSGNNNIIFKRGDISYGLDDLIGGGNSNITLTSVSGDIIPYINNAFNLGDVSKNWRNAYIRDLSVSNISISGTVNGITKAMVGLTNVDNTTDANKPVSTATQTALDLKANLASPIFSGTITIPSGVSILSNSVAVTSEQLAFVSGATRNIQTQLTELSNNKVNSANPSFTGTVTLPSNCINSNHIINGSILTEDICNNAITNDKIAANAVTNTRIDDGAVTHTKLSSDCIQSHNIVDGTILLQDLSSSLQTILNNAKRPKANLIIHNSATSTTTLGYSIELYDDGTLIPYFITAQPIGIGLTHNIFMNLPNITTLIRVIVDTDNTQITDNAVISGATQVGTFFDDALTFTLDEGSDNIQIGFEASPN
uniref:Tail fiber protein n=1 Tax=viral metagenome TaxID=1070528 RepID=A0A6C0H4M0_9ZZZZ